MSNPFTGAVQRATDPSKNDEDWALYLELVDKVQAASSDGTQKAYKAVWEKVTSKENVKSSVKGLTLLGVLVDNVGDKFIRVAFNSEGVKNYKTLLALRTNTDPAVCDKSKEMLQKWASEYGTNHSSLLNLYWDLSSEGHDFPRNGPKVPARGASGGGYSSSGAAAGGASSKQEEDDLAEAIRRSLAEAEAQKKKSKKNKKATGEKLYNMKAAEKKSGAGDNKKRVQALFDFQAIEDGELSFKKDEVIVLLDDSNEGWWYGELKSKKGLFPSNYVTPYTGDGSGAAQVQPQLVVDETKIDNLMQKINTTDVTRMTERDDQDIENQYQEIMTYRSVILSDVDELERKKQDLEIINDKFCMALSMYDKLMRGQPVQAGYGGGYGGYDSGYGAAGGLPPQQQQQQYYQPQPGFGAPPQGEGQGGQQSYYPGPGNGAPQGYAPTGGQEHQQHVRPSQQHQGAPVAGQQSSLPQHQQVPPPQQYDPSQQPQFYAPPGSGA
eukprot:Clim_evm45s246 gene=Clim_evmTU45s246